MTSAAAGACDGDVIAPYQGSSGRPRLSTAASVSSPMTDGRAPKDALARKHFYTAQCRKKSATC